MNLLPEFSIFLVALALCESQFTFPDFGAIQKCNNDANCVQLEACPGAVEHLKLGIRPGIICGFNDKRAKICCGEQHFGTLSAQKCKEFYKDFKPNPKHDHKEFGEYPYLAALGYGTPGKINWDCVGTLISNKFILTSAQCLNHHKHGIVKVVRLGDTKLNLESDDANAKNYKIKKITPHPFFKLPELYYDLGLIELQETVEFNEAVRPACLQTEDKFVEEFVLAGWKSDEFLRILMLDYTEISNKHWNLVFKTNLQDKYPNLDNETHIVANMLFNKGPCQTVDEGSPLALYSETTKIESTVFAITSLPMECGQPGIYTRIVKYLPWIETIVWHS